MSRLNQFIFCSLLGFLAACSTSESADNGPKAPVGECQGVVAAPVVGTSCSLTSECASDTLLCISGVCTAPDSAAAMCGADGSCKAEGTECGPAGYCVASNQNCDVHADCQLGYECAGPDGNLCVRVADACEDRSETLNLRGDWSFNTTLRLREAIGGQGSVGDGIGDIAVILRDMRDGRVNPDILKNVIKDSFIRVAISSIVSQIGSQAMKDYIPAEALDVADALASVSDILNDMPVKMTVGIGGKACANSYRGSVSIDEIHYKLAGVTKVIKPISEPGLGEITSNDFGVVNACGTVFLDKHRYGSVFSRIPTVVMNTAITTLTAYSDARSALKGVIDCEGMANGDFYIRTACNTFVDLLVTYAETKINEAAEKLNLITLQGYATPAGDDKLTRGKWSGSVVGAKFSGDFTGTKR